jgi:hypothetical protein
MVISSAPRKAARTGAKTETLETTMSSHGWALFGIAIPACLLFVGSILLLSRRRSLASWLQLIGLAGLMMVADGRADAFRRGIRSDFWMHWGAEESAGHYVDLGSALPGLTLFPIGYLAHALARSRVRRLATSSPCTSEHLVLIRRAFNLKQLTLAWRMGSGMAGGWPARRIAVRFWPSAHLSGVIDKNEELDTAASPKATQEKALL